MTGRAVCVFGGFAAACGAGGPAAQGFVTQVLHVGADGIGVQDGIGIDGRDGVALPPGGKLQKQEAYDKYF